MSIDLIGPLEALKRRLERVEEQLSAPETAANRTRLEHLSREHARLGPIIAKFKRFRKGAEERKELQHLSESSEAEIRKLAAEDLAKLESEMATLEHELQLAILPKDRNEDRNVILEIRAGTGGDEAGLFAAGLLRMYTRYAEARGWTVEPMDSSVSERGGIKEVVVQISGPQVWSHFKYERGVHRVQRVPVTEASGRIHTSTATVAVLPEAEEIDVRIDPADLRIDTYRASGAGGQHVNKTESAIRITHLPSGIVVACQDERSQGKNRAKAMKLLRSKLLEQSQEKQAHEISQNRRNQVGTGDRSEKIRTYNFPQDRITDHRINFNIHNLPSVMEGNLDPLIQELQRSEQIKQLSELASEKANP